MKKIVFVLALLLFGSVGVESAKAWTYSIDGAGVCNTATGEYDLTWTVNNPEPEALTVLTSTRPAVVAVGETVPLNSSEDFTESVPGTSIGETLDLTVNWPSDLTPHPASKLIPLAGTCVKTTPPVTPPVTTTKKKSSGGKCEEPSKIQGFRYDGGSPGDGIITLKWKTKSSVKNVDITVYAADKTTVLQKFRTKDDGKHVLTGLKAHPHWFKIRGMNNCGLGDWSKKIDPLP